MCIICTLSDWQHCCTSNRRVTETKQSIFGKCLQTMTEKMEQIKYGMEKVEQRPENIIPLEENKKQCGSAHITSQIEAR